MESIPGKVLAKKSPFPYLVTRMVFLFKFVYSFLDSSPKRVKKAASVAVPKKRKLAPVEHESDDEEEDDDEENQDDQEEDEGSSSDEEAAGSSKQTTKAASKKKRSQESDDDEAEFETPSRPTRATLKKAPKRAGKKLPLKVIKRDYAPEEKDSENIFYYDAAVGGGFNLRLSHWLRNDKFYIHLRKSSTSGANIPIEYLPAIKKALSDVESLIDSSLIAKSIENNKK